MYIMLPECIVLVSFEIEALSCFATSQPAIICSKLTIQTIKQGVKYVQSFVQSKYEHISYLVLAFRLLTLNM